MTLLALVNQYKTTEQKRWTKKKKKRQDKDRRINERIRNIFTEMVARLKVKISRISQISCIKGRSTSLYSLTCSEQSSQQYSQRKIYSTNNLTNEQSSQRTINATNNLSNEQSGQLRNYLMNNLSNEQYIQRTT